MLGKSLKEKVILFGYHTFHTLYMIHVSPSRHNPASAERNQNIVKREKYLARLQWDWRLQRRYKEAKREKLDRLQEFLKRTNLYSKED